MLLRDYILASRRRLETIYPPREATALADTLAGHYLGADRHSYIINPRTEVDPLRETECSAALERLCEGEPLQYIIGQAPFYGKLFNVNPNVLIPRPETELLCRMAIMEMDKSDKGREIRILDLCTGSGCIAWTMALEIPGSRVVAVDVSEGALEVAANQGLSGDGVIAPRFVRADILDPSSLEEELGEGGRFDLVLSNPPYVLESERAVMEKNVLQHEPPLALFVEGDDTMVFNKKIAKIAKKFMHTDGVGFVEINEALGDAALDVFLREGFAESSLVKDLEGKTRFVRIAI